MGVVLTTISKTVSNLSKGVVTDYALYILISICFYVSIYTFAPTLFDSVNSVIVSCVSVLIANHNFIVYLSDEESVGLSGFNQKKSESVSSSRII